MDAGARWLWDRGHGPLFPIEIGVRNDETGRPPTRLLPRGTSSSARVLDVHRSSSSHRLCVSPVTVSMTMQAT